MASSTANGSDRSARMNWSIGPLHGLMSSAIICSACAARSLSTSAAPTPVAAPLTTTVLFSSLLLGGTLLFLPVSSRCCGRRGGCVSQRIPLGCGVVAEGGEGPGEISGGRAHDLGAVLDVQRVAQAGRIDSLPHGFL